ncbi:MAG TPA: protein kinase [Candidatus Saccharimonadales bacterium]|nr:protein kinase [Candidatus Saccharimonadales bacterium]
MIIHSHTNTYRCIKLINEGGFGSIYKATDLQNNKTVIVKIEKKESLINEIDIYNHIKQYNNVGYPTLYDYVINDHHKMIILQELGSSLSQLFIQFKKFSLKTTIQCGLQMLTRIQTLHEFGIVHHDIKPSNFAFDLNDKTIYLFDFGLSEFYMIDGIHRDIQHIDKMNGTYQYSSRNVHQGILYSRRDDLESWIYILIKFLKGFLPWQHVKPSKQILHLKKTFTAQRLTKHLPYQFYLMLVYIKNLSYKQNPDYNLLKRYLCECAKDAHIVCDDDYDIIL